LAGASRAYSEALEECRYQNDRFYAQVMDLLA
jgi:hypothetical protein